MFNGYLRSVATTTLVTVVLTLLLIGIHKREMDGYRVAGLDAMSKIDHIALQQDSVRLEIAIERFERTQLGLSLDSLATEVKHLRDRVK